KRWRVGLARSRLACPASAALRSTASRSSHPGTDTRGHPRAPADRCGGRNEALPPPYPVARQLALTSRRITYLVTQVKRVGALRLLRAMQQLSHSSQLRNVVRCTICTAHRHEASQCRGIQHAQFRERLLLGGRRHVDQRRAVHDRPALTGRRLTKAEAPGSSGAGRFLLGELRELFAALLELE